MILRGLGVLVTDGQTFAIIESLPRLKNLAKHCLGEPSDQTKPKAKPCLDLRKPGPGVDTIFRQTTHPQKLYIYLV